MVLMKFLLVRMGEEERREERREGGK